MKKKEKKFKQKKFSSSLPSAGSSFHNWMRILIQNRFRVGLKFIPRAILVTIMSLFFAPFAILEKIFFNRKIKKTKVKSPVFIIGHMRSGTTFLHYLISCDPRFTTCSTTQTIFPNVFLITNKLIKAIMRAALPKKRPMDGMTVGENLPQEDEFAIANMSPYSPYVGAYFPKNIEKYYDKYSLFKGINNKIKAKWAKKYKFFAQKIVFASGGKRLLSKSLVNSSRIIDLQRLFPHSKFIFIYRHPYNLFLSTRKLYKTFIFKDMAFQSVSDEEVDSIIIKLAKKGFRSYIDNRDKIGKDNIVEIKFEDVIKNPLEHLKKIYSTLGISEFDKVKPIFQEYIKGYSNYKSQVYRLSDSLKKHIYTELKFFFDEFGYDKDIF